MNERKKHLMWIVELLIWFLIIAILASGFMFFRIQYKKITSTYQIFLPDVDGLITGSPVRIMGIQVGYISQVEIVGDDVYVKFRINDKGVKLPQGTVATVEFSGLGGSKSLELYPPKKNTVVSDKLIMVERPKRLHDSFGLLYDMFETLGEITYKFSDFFGKAGFTEKDNHGKTDVQKYEKTLDDMNIWLDKKNKKEKNKFLKMKKEK